MKPHCFLENSQTILRISGNYVNQDIQQGKKNAKQANNEYFTITPGTSVKRKKQIGSFLIHIFAYNHKLDWLNFKS